MALGFNLSIARLATALNDNLTPYLEDKSSVVLAAWVGLAVCIMSFISSAIVLYLDRPSSRLKCGVKSYETQLLEYKIHVEENRELLREEKVSTSALSDCILDEEDNLNDLEEDPDETIHIEQINGLGVSFWTLCATTIALYGFLLKLKSLFTSRRSHSILSYLFRFFSTKMVPKQPKVCRLCHVNT